MAGSSRFGVILGLSLLAPAGRASRPPLKFYSVEPIVWVDQKGNEQEQGKSLVFQLDHLLADSGFQIQDFASGSTPTTITREGGEVLQLEARSVFDGVEYTWNIISPVHKPFGIAMPKMKGPRESKMSVFQYLSLPGKLEALRDVIINHRRICDEGNLCQERQ